MEANLEFLGREVIKPASPAPHDHVQLSLLDLSCPRTYVSTIFFYNNVAGKSPEIISRSLKTSLSETLSRFCPLAGRIEGLSISCNNEGAVFSEARTNLLLSDFLKNYLGDNNYLGEFAPTFEPGESAGTWPLLSVKVSFFGSGSGVAISVAISHLVCDAPSLLTFVSNWAASTAKGESSDVALSSPPFAGVTIYPSSNASSMNVNSLQLRVKTCVTNRFVFKSTKISELKLKAASENVPVPTRVEVISWLIWRCATKSSRSNSVTPKSTLMSQAMDLRLRIPSALLARDTMGNLQSAFFIKKGSESEMEIGEIVADFRKAKEGVNEMIKENLQDYNAVTTTLGQTLLGAMGKSISELKLDVDYYVVTSWCKQPFYKVDFGWGDPVWMGYASYTICDNMVCVVLIDSKDGEDVEAWVSLPKQDMSVFICDQDLLAYAVLNPPILI